MTEKAGTKTKVTASLFVNDYEVPMLELKLKPRSVFISVKKALAILETNNNASLITTVNKYGRELFKVEYGDGKGFTIGENKINAVLDNAKAIEKAIA